MRRNPMAHYRNSMAEIALDTLRLITRRLTGKSPRRWYEESRWLAAKLTGRGGMLRKRILGQQMYLNPRDIGISRELAIYKVHEPHITKWLQTFIKPGMVVIDIGANIGYYALIEARLVGPQGKVIAIEPAPENVRFLNMNVRVNSLQNVEVHPLAVGDRDGVGTLHLTRASNLNTMGVVDSEHQEIASLKVSVKALDTLVAGLLPRIDLIRMDIEGFETVAIKGMKKTLETYRPILLVEVHADTAGEGPTVAFLETLVKLGYQLEHLVDRHRDRAWMRHAPLGRGYSRQVPGSIEELLADERVSGSKAGAFNAVFVNSNHRAHSD